MEGPIASGELITHNLTELIKPEAYEVRLTPITRFGEGDATIRIVTYSGEDPCPHASPDGVHVDGYKYGVVKTHSLSEICKS